MKRYLVLAAIVAGLVLIGLAFAQQPAATPGQGTQPTRRPQDMTEEERAKMRERFQNMSEEERAKVREQMGAAGGGGRMGMRNPEEQLKAIAAIEEQLGKLKASVKSTAGMDFAKIRDLPEEEQTKMREKMTKAREERQAALTAIDQQMVALRGPQAPVNEEALKELRGILELAQKEKAQETAKRVEALIAKSEPRGRGGFGGTRGGAGAGGGGQPRGTQ